MSSRFCFRILLALLVFIPGCQEKPVTQIKLTDDFENSRLADFWLPGKTGEGRYEQEAVSITDRYHRSGHHSAQLLLKKGFIRQDGGDGHFTERTELDSRPHPFLDQRVWYKFSLLIPQNFPIVDNRLVISQVKQTVLFGNPLLVYAQRFRNGKHYLTIYDMTDKEKNEQATFVLPELTKEEWHDFVFQVYYSDTPQGFIHMWMDGIKVVSFSGTTANKRGRNQFYHKIGLYRDQWPEPMLIYFDHYILTNDNSEIEKDPSFSK